MVFNRIKTQWFHEYAPIAGLGAILHVRKICDSLANA